MEISVSNNVYHYEWREKNEECNAIVVATEEAIARKKLDTVFPGEKEKVTCEEMNFGSAPVIY